MIKRNNVSLMVILATVLLIVTPFAYLNQWANAASSGNSDEWPMFRHDSRHTGYSTSTAPTTNETKWVYDTTMAVVSSPAVADDRVIVGISSESGSNSRVVALNAVTGEQIWSHEIAMGPNSIWSSPAISAGKVFIGTGHSNSLICLDESTGALLWEFSTGDKVDSSPLVSNGKVFFGSYDRKLYCLNANDGTLVWSFTTNGAVFGQMGGAIHSSPAILNDVIFVGCRDERMYAVNASTGVEIWSYWPGNTNPASNGISTSPTVHDGKVFYATGDKFYCLDATSGALVWTTPGEIDFSWSSPAVVNGRVFVGDQRGNFYCFDSDTGSAIWQFTTQGKPEILSSPAVADGKVFFGTGTPGLFYCLNENTGAELWSYRTLERVVSSPAIADDIVFVGSSTGVYAFGQRHSLPTSLSLSMKSQTSVLGFKVDLTGKLESKGTPIGNASILLSYSVTGGQSWNDITVVPTSADGSYSAIWIPSATGTYLVKATWKPYYPYEAAEATRMLSVNSFDGQNVFSVTSNSTVSALAFNSTTNELSFTVMGPAGTTGFVDMGIAKNLVNDVANLRVHLDGTNLNYVATSTTDSWLLHFEYTHSTHNVVVSLSSETNNPTPPPVELPILPIAAAVIVGVVLVLLVVVGVRKRASKSKPTEKQNKEKQRT